MDNINPWIIIGNKSTSLSEKKSENTHEWVCYIKSVDTDLSSLLEKVSFKLHESFQNPLRTVSEFPFEIKESGWGEFEIQIKLHFRNSNIKPLLTYHMLKLYPETDRTDQNVVISERFERLIFNSANIDDVLPEGSLVVAKENEEYEKLSGLLVSINHET
jgi:YEATS domain-containing protein 4